MNDILVDEEYGFRPNVSTAIASYKLINEILQGAAERTPRFGRGIASGGERVQWWGACRRTAVYVPISVYTMAWSGEHRAFVVEEFIKNGGSPVISGGCRIRHI